MQSYLDTAQDQLPKRTFDRGCFAHNSFALLFIWPCRRRSVGLSCCFEAALFVLFHSCLAGACSYLFSETHYNNLGRGVPDISLVGYHYSIITMGRGTNLCSSGDLVSCCVIVNFVPAAYSENFSLFIVADCVVVVCRASCGWHLVLNACHGWHRRHGQQTAALLLSSLTRLISPTCLLSFPRFASVSVTRLQNFCLIQELCFVWVPCARCRVMGTVDSFSRLCLSSRSAFVRCLFCS